jgi:hypothetical protein
VTELVVDVLKVHDGNTGVADSEQISSAERAEFLGGGHERLGRQNHVVVARTGGTVELTNLVPEEPRPARREGSRRAQPGSRRDLELRERGVGHGEVEINRRGTRAAGTGFQPAGRKRAGRIQYDRTIQTRGRITERVAPAAGRRFTRGNHPVKATLRIGTELTAPMQVEAVDEHEGISKVDPGATRIPDANGIVARPQAREREAEPVAALGSLGGESPLDGIGEDV